MAPTYSIKLVVAFVLYLLVCVPLRGATINAASTSLTDVSNAVFQAVNGDIISIPAGTSAWTARLLVTNKAVRLVGAGTNSTMIVDSYTNGTELIRYEHTNLNYLAEITGIHFSSGDASGLYYAIIHFVANNNQTNTAPWRVHHNLFTQTNSRPMNIRAWGGLVDSNIFYNASGIMFDNRIYAGEWGDESFALPMRYGTTNAGVYVEGNYWSNVTLRGISDTAAGTRFVYRYNTVINGGIQSHGTESTGRARGLRGFEIYGNRFTNNAVFGESVMHFRSGTGLVFSNICDGLWPSLIRPATYRMWDPFGGWGQADGTNAWDLNDPVEYATGTHTGTNGARILTDSNANWSANQWVGYSLQNCTRATTTRAGAAGVISSNSPTEIATANSIFTVNRVYWTNGEAYRIVRVIQALDAPGNAWGALLSGGSDSTPASPWAWPGQTNEPIHYWNNVGETELDASTYDIRAVQNYTNIALTGYTPLQFPHPLAGGGTNPPPASRTSLRTTTLTIGNSLKL